MIKVLLCSSIELDRVALLCHRELNAEHQLRKLGHHIRAGSCCNGVRMKLFLGGIILPNAERLGVLARAIEMDTLSYCDSP